MRVDWFGPVTEAAVQVESQRWYHKDVFAHLVCLCGFRVSAYGADVPKGRERMKRHQARCKAGKGR